MFISLEGMEGAGKSTLIKGLAERLYTHGKNVVLTREPGGCPLGMTLRKLLLDVDSRPCAEAELFLFLADRAQHTAEIIRPALERGDTVITDRYADSTVVYQGYGRGIDIPTLFDQNNLAVRGLWPDITFILDVPVEEGLRRALVRNAEQGIADSEGRFEAEAISFHTKIRQGFLDWGKQHSDRCIVLDATMMPLPLLDTAWSFITAKDSSLKPI